MKLFSDLRYLPAFIVIVLSPLLFAGCAGGSSSGSFEVRDRSTGELLNTCARIDIEEDGLVECMNEDWDVKGVYRPSDIIEITSRAG